MRIILLILLILLPCVSFYSQDKKETVETDIELDYDKDCGNPFVRSTLYEIRKGKVIKIISGNKILVAVNDEGGNEIETINFVVALAGVDTSSNSSEAKKILTEKALNQNVEVTGNVKNDGDRKLFAFVSVPERFADFSWYFLKNGIGKYKKPKYKRSVPPYTLCQYRKTEAEAQKEKLGIWAK